MADMKKVLKGLECCILHNPDDHARCMQCPYESNCVNRLKMDALELLKEQNQRIWELLTDNERLNDLLKELKEVKHHDQKTQAETHQADHPVP